MPCVKPNFYASKSVCAPCPSGSTSPALSDGLVACTCPDGTHPSLAGCAAPLAPVVVGGSGLPAATLGGALGGAALLMIAVGMLARRELVRRHAQAHPGWRAVVATAGEVNLGALLGEGSFGAVYKAEWRGTVVAAKVMTSGRPRGSPTQAATAAGPALPGAVPLLLPPRPPLPPPLGCTGHVAAAAAAVAVAGRRLLGCVAASCRPSPGEAESTAVPPAESNSVHLDTSFAKEVEFLSKLRHPNSCERDARGRGC